MTPTHVYYIVEIVEVISTNNPDVTGMVASMQVPKTGFETKDLLCMLLTEVCYTIVPKLGPTCLC